MDRPHDSHCQPADFSILIIEDDPTLVKLYRMVIGIWPFPVQLTVAKNAFEGLVMVGNSTPDMLISDLRLPGGNAFHMIRTLAAMDRCSRMGIVVVSGMTQHEIDAHGGLPPMVERMIKPIDFNRLRNVADVLRMARDERHAFEQPVATSETPP